MCEYVEVPTNPGNTNPRLIAPGSAARSVGVARMDRIGANATAPLARHIIDDDGVQLVTDRINGLAGCN